MVLRLKLRLSARSLIAYLNLGPRSQLIILSIVSQLIFIMKSVIIENKKPNITVLPSRISNKI